MSENERLTSWMSTYGFEINTLAEALGVSYSTVYMQTRGGRPVSDTIKWRFALCFGMDNAKKIFNPPISTAAPILAYA